MDDTEDPPIAIPEWVVTFGDMMSLLLTFFIMLVSLSEIKEEEKYQALVDSMRRQFGYTQSLDSLSPGDSRPRTSAFTVLATTGRAKRDDTAKGGVPDPAPKGEEPQVRIIRPGRQTAVGSVIFFPADDATLDATARRVLDSTAEQLRGKPQKVEIRGHTSPQTAARALARVEPMDLGYARSRAVMEYLVEQHDLDVRRFRISSAGNHEPMHASSDPSAMQSNPRVEVFLLDESVSDLRGTPAERAREVIQAVPNEGQHDG